jgi:DNA-binding NtrC family response regulator
MKNLEKVIKDKVRPNIDKRTEEILGVSIEKIGDDITSKLRTNILEDINIDYDAKFKEAKKRFKRDYLIKVLLLNLGNISEVARLLGISRRSLHRMISDFNINVKKIKKELVKPYSLSLSTMNLTVGHVFSEYKNIIHPQKLKKMYSNVGRFSEDILKNFPLQIIPLEKAEKIFEKKFIQKSLLEHGWNISRTAKAIGLRFETLHRKMKSLRIEKKR